MKNLFIVFVFLTFICTNFSQITEAKVDLKEIFRQQVIKAKEKEFKKAIEKGSVTNSFKIVKKIPAKPLIPENMMAGKKISKQIEKSTNTELLYIFVLFEISLLLSILFIYKYKTKNYKVAEVREFKNNIKQLRDEKINFETDVKLAQLRKKLVKNKIDYSPSAITLIAKKLGISKGEVHLAAKLNILSSK